ncbi:PRC-barrel domain-containing protein [Methylocystis sp. L43]|jgi:nicotinamide riboside transporter PnuC|nr:PRC-barrel domain-containing protein [Methylocystis sp. L43]MBG0807604.1 PRC-barrel domain-containing protein [Methylocystis sp. H15]
MIAAMMTAANAGARTTGWGFVVFTVGSVAWSLAATYSHQRNLLLTNLFLTAVNLIGVWRWLGRQARHEDGSIKAVRKSQAGGTPTLFSASAAVGASVIDASGEKLGVVVDLMLKRDQRGLAYVVIAEYELGGVGETLRAVDPACIEFTDGVAHIKMSRKELDALPALQTDDWPSALPPAAQRIPGASDRA